VKSNGKIGGYVYGERVKSQILAREGIKIKAGRIMDFDKEKFYF
jgi:methylated-DNA-[protein]-cysteine S-methyltransferase